jgi:hypothetical protein
MHTSSSSSFTLTLYTQAVVVFWVVSMLYLSLLCPVVLLTIDIVGLYFSLALCVQ